MTKKYRKFTQLLDEYLKDEKFAAEFLSQALEEEDFSTFLLSLKDVIRVHGSLSSIAEKCDISRSTLYNFLSKKANPEMKTILALLHVLGYELKVAKKQSHAVSKRRGGSLSQASRRKSKKIQSV
jgi:probable addiction module antidote protein